MKGLSIRQPWTHAVFHYGKNIENRDWHTPIRGRVAIHASGTMSKYDYAEAHEWILEHVGFNVANRIPLSENLVRGSIIGTVEIVDCVKHSPSPWFVGKFGFVLRDPVLLPKPVPFKAMLGFWEVPKDIIYNICESCGRSRDGHARAMLMHERGACDKFIGEFEC